MQSAIRKSKKINSRSGSALILAVVLTSLLALVGVMFVMTARVDKVATSSISENRELNFAIESVIAKISQELVLDVPRMPRSKEEYYDYPDEKNTWLASLEPYEETGNHYWKQISDVTGFLEKENWDTQDIEVDIIKDHEKITLDSDGNIEGQSGAQGGQLADADGDGVADSKWIELDDITSGKGSPVYAAIRVVDNGGMLNVNTAYKFDANETDSELIDGSSQMQINLAALSLRGETNPPLDQAAEDLHNLRCGGNGASVSISDYLDDVVRRYYVPDGEYTPFDISDEMELRNRFLLNHLDIDARIEKDLWANAFEKPNLEVPVDTGGIKLTDWFYRAQHDVIGPNDIYSYRHIATTYNMDRIINRIGWRLTNINRETNPLALYNVLVASIDPNVVKSDSDRERLKRRFAQLAVNIVDYVDEGIDVEVFDNLPDPEDHDADVYYGFEAQPFISEIAMRIGQFVLSEGGHYGMFAVELYNPFNQDISLENFKLELKSNGSSYEIVFDGSDIIRAGRCFVISDDPSEFNIASDAAVKDDDTLKNMLGGLWKLAEQRPPIDRRRGPDESKPPIHSGWQSDSTLLLKRQVENGEWIYVDRQYLERHLEPSDEQRGYERDARDWHIVYQTLEEDEGRGRSRGSLGTKNDIDPSVFRGQHDFSFFLPKPILKSSDPPSLRPYTEFRTVGDITRILTIGNSVNPDDTIGEQLEQTRGANEGDVRLDLENPYHRNIFQYLTVFDPTDDDIDNDGDKNTDEINFMETPEYQIAGRININTAPWYVIKQLPWVSGKLARAIVAYRDKLNLDGPVNYKIGRYKAIEDELDSLFDWDDIREDEGFESIGELNFVIDGDDEYSIAKHALDGDELAGFPDLTTDGGSRGDGIRDDFEERDIIFSRISNLVTVRSDVFTAYILVRIGADGPQKRVIAILDRSNVYAGNGKVRIVAQHFVPDPR